MNDELSSLVRDIRRLATQYYQLTGKPLGVTGELGEIAVAELMGFKLAVARKEVFDALKPDGTQVQIKARAVKNTKKFGGQRIGAIKLEKQWDTVMLVIMSNKTFEPIKIYEAQRVAIQNAISRVPEVGQSMRTEGKARKKGALAISEFIRISNEVWSAP
ncbi:MAG: DUF6998 domain-containing protein [Parvibaculales bacterium]